MKKSCLACSSYLPPNARFCHYCGAAVSDIDDRDKAFSIDELYNAFVNNLVELVTLLFEKKRVSKYLSHLEASSYRDLFEDHLLAIARYGQKEDGDVLHRTIPLLSLDFLVRHCKKINEVDLREEVLQYGWVAWPEVDLFKMALDFLDFAYEPDVKVFIDMHQMPFDKLNNAGKSYLFPAKNERILLICDGSIFGSCREGFALSDKGIYWRNHFAKPQSVAYHDLETLRRKEDWITINEKFLNIKQSINVKLLLFLFAVKRMIAIQETQNMRT